MMTLANGVRVWFDGPEAPTHWKCPHDKCLIQLQYVARHLDRFHSDCWSCRAEELLCRALLDIASIPAGRWHGRLAGEPPVPGGA